MPLTRANAIRRVLARAGAFDLVLFNAAIFLLFACVGFLVDIMSGGRGPAGSVAANVVFSGAIALAYAWAGLTHPALVSLPVAVHFVYVLWFRSSPLAEAALSPTDALKRLQIDALGVVAGLAAGYACFIAFIHRTGARYIAAQTEIELARDIHRSLVPPVETRLDAFEFSGRSEPSGEVGGDLVDVVDLQAGAWAAYVADVSGHGVSSGVLMAMVKSAMRAELQAAPAGEVLGCLNRTLTPLTPPAMFVTLALVRCASDGRLSFALAGHLPILRIRPDGAVEELLIQQLPLGVDARAPYVEAPLPCEPGDLLVLVTDGLVEVFDAADREFGLERLKSVLAAHRSAPLSHLGQTMLETVRRHGAQLDDQTWLFIRRRA
ncbi:MAG TPA: PP2C family protein-serine/threonine phosphatase [Vicinamibacterales bacterium]|nr:PP2C family protein-serine/threonine phosphatase [Vicinamibacterales bacterium]